MIESRASLGRDVLVVMELRKLGDAILSLPFVRGAKERYEVFILCHPASRPIYEQVLPADHIITVVPPWVEFKFELVYSLIQVIRRLRSLHPAVAVCGWADARVEWLMRLCGARRRVGFPMTPLNYYAWRVPWRTRHLCHGRWLSIMGTCLTGGVLLNERLSRIDEHQAHVDDWRQVSGVLGVDLDVSFPWLKAGVLADHSFNTWLARVRHSGRPVWALHPGAGAEVKKWDAAGFRHVVQTYFCDNRIPVVVVNAPGDPPLGVDGEDVVCLSPRDFSELVSLAGRVDAVLCNDSAMSHLAAAMGKRVVAVFGPSDPGSFAPYANAENLVIKSVCPFRPCMDLCLMPSRVCMDSIRIEDVIEKVKLVQGELMLCSREAAVP